MHLSKTDKFCILQAGDHAKYSVFVPGILNWSEIRPYCKVRQPDYPAEVVKLQKAFGLSWDQSNRSDALDQMSVIALLAMQ